MYAGRGGGYIAASRYSKYVPLWKANFGENNVLIVRTEDLKESQRRVASRCFEFLGLSDLTIGDPVHQHKTSQVTRNLGHMPQFFQSAVSLLPGWLKRIPGYKPIRRRVLRVLTPSPPDTISEKEREEVIDRLSPDIEFYESIEPV